MKARRIRSARIGWSAVLLAPATVFGSVDVCDQPEDFSRLSVGYYEQDSVDLATNAGEVRRDYRDVDLQYRRSDTWLLGLGYRYVILDVEPVALQTNGHLHTLFFPLHRQSGSDDARFRFSVAPALSASSNVMKDPGEYTADTLQLLGAVAWSRALSERVKLRYGLCGDHRFGPYRVYPSITLDWRPRPDLMIRLGLPVTRLSYAASRTIGISLQVSPDGNEWHVRSKDLEKQSRLVARAWVVEWALTWRASERSGIRVGVARTFRNRYDVTLLDGTRVELSHDAATRLGAALEWRF